MKNIYDDFLTKFSQCIEDERPIIFQNERSLQNDIIKEWAQLIAAQSQKGIIPLFVTGSGISPNIPNMSKIINKLKDYYDDKKNELDNFHDEERKSIESLFQQWIDYGLKDKSVISGILKSFQDERSAIYPIWINFNEWLLKDNVLKATPSTTHKIIAKLYDELRAICLTLNFDGLLVKELRENSKSAFSIPYHDECEKFFLRTGTLKEYMEIQARGDILYMKCQGNTEGRGYCPEMDLRPRSLWAYFSPNPAISTDELYKTISKCPSCNGKRVSYLSFPGAYEKDRDTQRILSKIWQYLAIRIGSVTVLGLSGAWDSLIVAFLADLLRERSIPLLVVDKYPNASYLIKELVLPAEMTTLALEMDHTDFSEELNKSSFTTQKINELQPPENDCPYDEDYWRGIIKDPTFNDFQISDFEKELINYIVDNYKINRYAQLGLKSRWLGKQNANAKKHNRLAHSIGVMKLTSYLYDKIFENTSEKLKKENEKRFLRIAALFHDIGHLPFAHLIEEVFMELNWQPAKFQSSFTHSLNTEMNINDMFQNNSNFEKSLNNLGYKKEDLIRLINGGFGVSYLDALINSPIDADKIDYVFRDTTATEKRVLLSPEQFIKDIVAEISITPEDLLAFSGISAKAAFELLEARKFLYHNLYIRPGIRYLENAVRFILITYFVHFVDLSPKNPMNKDKRCADLGYNKIISSIEHLNILVKSASQKKADSEMELELLKEIKENLLSCDITEKVKVAIKNCYKKVSDTKNEDEIKRIETQIKYYTGKKMSGPEKKRYENAAKACQLRLPGSVLIDVVDSPRFLSIADSRKEYERSDGTKTHSECIIIPDGDPKTWYRGLSACKPLISTLKSVEESIVSVYLYPITDDKSYFNQAVNLFTKLVPEVEYQEED